MDRFDLSNVVVSSLFSVVIIRVVVVMDCDSADNPRGPCANWLRNLVSMYSLEIAVDVSLNFGYFFGPSRRSRLIDLIMDSENSSVCNDGGSLSMLKRVFVSVSKK